MNVVFLSGRIGSVKEKQTRNGNSYTTVRLAVRRWDGQQESAEWYNIYFYNGLSDLVRKAGVGSLIGVRGELRSISTDSGEFVFVVGREVDVYVWGNNNDGGSKKPAPREEEILDEVIGAAEEEVVIPPKRKAKAPEKESHSMEEIEGYFDDDFPF